MNIPKPETTFVLRNFGSLTNLEAKDQFIKHMKAPKGTDIFARYYPALDYVNKSKKDGLWIQERGMQTAPTSYLQASDDQKQHFYGSNFASNNYLGLSTHPQIVSAAVEGARTFGVNSAGSPLAFGATKYYMQLKEQIAEFLKCKALIYSVGWLSGFGSIKGLIREWDYVVMDEFVDNSLVVGAEAATANVFRFRHLDQNHMESILKDIRAKDSQNAILVITESIFGMDSTSPNLVNCQKIAKAQKAFLAISCHHDIGVIGQNGKGVWEEQKLQDRSNVILIATGSKSFSINFGFIGCTDECIPQYFKYYSTAYMFTNAINPVQANAALSSLRTIRSEEGKRLREKVLSNAGYLRDLLQAKNYEVLGRLSPFVCVKVGNEIVSRLIIRILMDNEIHANKVQYPQAPLGQAVIRFSLMPNHTREQLRYLVEAFQFAFKNAQEIFGKQMTTIQEKAKLQQQPRF